MIRTLVCIQAVLLDFYLLLHESHTKIKFKLLQQMVRL